MDPLPLDELPAVLDGEGHGTEAPGRVSTVSIDSRSVGYEALFFALRGAHTDGHLHLAGAFANGAAAAVLSHAWLAEERTRDLPGPAVAVASPLAALQRLAGWWRRRLRGRLVAVTGSNGKTIAKDALVHILSDRYRTAGTVGSYNSQLGVPLALLRIPRDAEHAVLEAGVSAPGEMDRLEEVLRPDCALLLNVGLAHIGSFGSREAIAREKLRLFARIPPGGWALLPAGDPLVEHEARDLACAVHRFGAPGGTVPWVEHARSLREGYRVTLRYPSGERFEALTAVPSLEILSDLDAALGAAHLLGMPPHQAVAALEDYRPPHTRLEIWRSPTRGVTLINDSCSSDPVSVKAALHSLETVAQESGRRVFVFGGMRELGPLHEREHASIGRLAATYGVDDLVLVGAEELDPTGDAYRADRAGGTIRRCRHPDEVRGLLQDVLRQGDTVLFKGPRLTGIDRAARSLLEAMAPNRIVLDLQAMAENVLALRRLLGSHRKVLGMIKALAYGSDLVRVGVELQRLGLDCLGVSTADEGSQLRHAGVDLPILVLLCSAAEVDKLVRHALTPALYSFELVEPLAEAARRAGKPLDVHLKLDTGLGRMGVFPGEIGALARRARATGWLRVVGLLTHLASAEDPAEDGHTRRQLALFEEARQALRGLGFGDLICHAAATAGAVRFPEARYDMVRIGLGLYGVYPSPAVAAEASLVLAVSLLSRVSEVRDFPPGSRIGYGGTYRVGPRGMRGAVLPIGYHDGVPRSLSNAGAVWIGGHPAPVVGRVSMDSMMVDASAVTDVREGSDVLLFGARDGVIARPEDLAEASGTIVHELLSRIGPRVERVFLG